MDGFKVAIVAMALTDTDWAPRRSRQRRRVLTAEELDALAEFDWPGAAVLGRLAAGATAMLSRVRSRASHRIAPTRLPAAEATAPG